MWTFFFQTKTKPHDYFLSYIFSRCCSWANKHVLFIINLWTRSLTVVHLKNQLLNFLSVLHHKCLCKIFPTYKNSDMESIHLCNQNYFLKLNLYSWIYYQGKTKESFFCKKQKSSRFIYTYFISSLNFICLESGHFLQYRVFLSYKICVLHRFHVKHSWTLDLWSCEKIAMKEDPW